MINIDPMPLVFGATIIGGVVAAFFTFTKERKAPYKRKVVEPSLKLRQLVAFAKTEAGTGVIAVNSLLSDHVTSLQKEGSPGFKRAMHQIRKDKIPVAILNPATFTADAFIFDSPSTALKGKDKKQQHFLERVAKAADIEIIYKNPAVNPVTGEKGSKHLRPGPADERPLPTMHNPASMAFEEEHASPQPTFKDATLDDQDDEYSLLGNKPAKKTLVSEPPVPIETTPPTNEPMHAGDEPPATAPDFAQIDAAIENALPAHNDLQGEDSTNNLACQGLMNAYAQIAGDTVETPEAIVKTPLADSGQILRPSDAMSKGIAASEIFHEEEERLHRDRTPITPEESPTTANEHAPPNSELESGEGLASGKRRFKLVPEGTLSKAKALLPKRAAAGDIKKAAQPKPPRIPAVAKSMEGAKASVKRSLAESYKKLDAAVSGDTSLINGPTVEKVVIKRICLSDEEAKDIPPRILNAAGVPVNDFCLLNELNPRKE